MDSTLEPPPAPAGPPEDKSIILMLGLYLLVLAFFILLVTISTLEEVKTQRVMDSLVSTFSSAIPPTTDLTAFQSKEGDILAGQQFQQEITGIFSTDIRVEKIENVQPGRLMRVLLDADSLFLEGSAQIRASNTPLLDRIVTALSSRSYNTRYDMEFVIGSRFDKDRSMPIGQTLEMARAGQFARDLMVRGAPPDSISVGLVPGDQNEINIWFYVRGVDEGKLDFEKLRVPDAVQPEAGATQ